MGFNQGKFQAVMTGSEEQRVEALRELLDYPLKQKDSEGSRFWYLCSGNNELEAGDTCLIAVGFFKELNQGAEREIEQWLTEDDQDKQIRGHYTNRIVIAALAIYSIPIPTVQKLSDKPNPVSSLPQNVPSTPPTTPPSP